MADFVNAYVNLMKRITDAPQGIYQEAAALFLISTAMGRRFQFFSVPETSIFSRNEAERIR